MTVPPSESIVKLPDDVSISLSPVTPIFMLPFVAPLELKSPLTTTLSWIVVVPPAESIMILPLVLPSIFAVVIPTLKFPISAPPSISINPVNVDNPVTRRLFTVEIPKALKSSPTFKFFSIPIPPSVISDPVSRLCELVSFVISKFPFNFIKSLTVNAALTLTTSLNVTGPSNCVRIVLDLPPSTTNLSLTITSSKITDSLDGSSPVTVGIGASNVLS